MAILMGFVCDIFVTRGNILFVFYVIYFARGAHVDARVRAEHLYIIFNDLNTCYSEFVYLIPNLFIL